MTADIILFEGQDTKMRHSDMGTKEKIGAFIGLVLLSMFCAHAQEVATHSKAIAVLHPTEGNKVKGTITFTKESEGIRVVARLEGLKPGEHGFHIHQFGDCSAPDAESAGGHFNPTSMPHAGPAAEKRHAGDLGNITADESGYASYDRVDKHLRLDGEESIIGRAVIVHEKVDDLKTQPTGNAGGRVACGVIGVAKAE
jgi:superoxide dismutase, Cu-Zn family